MFRSKCGKEIPDGVVFCNFCGTRQMISSETSINKDAVSGSDASLNNDTTPSKKKKKRNLLITGIIVAGVALIGQAAGKMIADSYDEKSAVANTISQSSEEDIEDYSSTTTAETEADNPEYTKIFSDRYIVMAPLFLAGQDVEAFAKVETDGTVDSLEFSYSDDVISTFRQTQYAEIADLSDDEKAVFDEEVRGMLIYLEAFDFVTSDYNMGAEYYRVSIEMSNLDDPEVLRIAEEEGLVELSGDGDWMSMEITESNLLADGYVKK